jgi:lipase
VVLGPLPSRPALRVREVPEVNHYTIVMGQAGARAVAESVQEALAVR